MEGIGIFRRLFMFLLGVTLGYCTGFKDAGVNDRMVFVRAVERVQNFGQRTLGDRARETEKVIEDVSDQ
ncbi:MAG: hypothetical protein V3S83_05675 [Gemmatimonadota bacterium]